MNGGEALAIVRRRHPDLVLLPLRPTSSWQRAGKTALAADLYETDQAVVIRLAISGGDGGALKLTIGAKNRSAFGRDPASRRLDRPYRRHWQQIPYNGSIGRYPCRARWTRRHHVHAS